MHILRFSTLTLTVAIAVMTLGYANPSFAGKKCTADSKHPSCKPPADAGNLYTVEGKGAFVFGPVPVTLEGQNSILRPDVDAVMTRPIDGFETTWDNVFSMPQADTGDPCNLFGLPGAVDSYTAHRKERHVKGWAVELPGGVMIKSHADQMTTALGADVNVGLLLIGNCEYSHGGTEPCDPFLPDPDTNYGHGLGISEITLSVFWIIAKAVKGTPAIEGCHSARTNLLAPSTLVITASSA